MSAGWYTARICIPRLCSKQARFVRGYTPRQAGEVKPGHFAEFCSRVAHSLQTDSRPPQQAYVQPVAAHRQVAHAIRCCRPTPNGCGQLRAGVPSGCHPQPEPHPNPALNAACTVQSGHVRPERSHVVAVGVGGQVHDPLGLVGALLHALRARVVVLEVLQRLVAWGVHGRCVSFSLRVRVRLRVRAPNSSELTLTASLRWSCQCSEDDALPGVLHDDVREQTFIKDSPV